MLVIIKILHGRTGLYGKLKLFGGNVLSDVVLRNIKKSLEVHILIHGKCRKEELIERIRKDIVARTRKKLLTKLS